MKLVNPDAMAWQPISHNSDIMKRVVMGESELPGSVRLSQARFMPGQVAGAHVHENIVEVFYLLEGQGCMVVNGASHRLEAGDSIRIDPGEVHELSNVGEGEMSVLYFGLEAEKKPRRKWQGYKKHYSL